MFLMDNELVREDYQAAKSLVSGIIESVRDFLVTSSLICRSRCRSFVPRRCGFI